MRMNNCENQCAGCPLVASLEQKLAYLQKDRAMVLAGLSEYMKMEADERSRLQALSEETGKPVTEIIADELLEKGQTTEQVAAQKAEKVRALDLYLAGLDKLEQTNLGLIYMLPALCVNGISRQLEITPDGTMTAQESCGTAEVSGYPEAMYKHTFQI